MPKGNGFDEEWLRNLPPSVRALNKGTLQQFEQMGQAAANAGKVSVSEAIDGIRGTVQQGNDTTPSPGRRHIECLNLPTTPADDPKVVKRKRQLEHAEQSAFFTQIERAIKDGHADYQWIFAIPNGTAATPRVGAMMVAEGVRAGVPDIMIAWPRIDPNGRVWHGCYIEMKEPLNGGKVSDKQRDWLSHLAHAGYKVAVCDTWRDAWVLTTTYMGWARPAPPEGEI
ncbi:MAG: VRR-NUC domain-containing protein [Capsulimonas sp.]|uniref:VRR-NUC domain-containing protein n=1 Tax=Capsulimonas sp. TaxID=2494211 RepID=UPI003265A08F